jgi:hypothetical protein
MYVLTQTQILELVALIFILLILALLLIRFTRFVLPIFVVAIAIFFVLEGLNYMVSHGLVTF